MNKAFIFDFDGIIIDSEPIWQIENDVIFKDLFGEEIQKKLGSTVGLSIALTHQKAVEYGTTVPLATYTQAIQERAGEVYRNARLAHGLDALKHELEQRNFHLAIVSASAQQWIEIVLQRLNWDVKDFKIIVSLNDRTDLAHKPSPDGYIHAIQELNASPETTIILEDSNAGIASAKAAGATVIGFKQFLLKDYEQKGADFYAATIEDVIKIIANFKE